MKINRTTRFNRQLKRDTAKATIDARSRVTITAGIVTISVLEEVQRELALGPGVEEVVEGEAPGSEM